MSVCVLRSSGRARARGAVRAWRALLSLPALVSGCASMMAVEETRPISIRTEARGQSAAGTPLRCASTFRIERWTATGGLDHRLYRGNAGGDVGVATLLPSGEAIESVADWSGTATLQRLADDTLEVRLQVGVAIEPSGTVVIRGRVSADGRSVRGPYTCTVRRTDPPLVLHGSFVLTFA